MAIHLEQAPDYPRLTLENLMRAGEVGHAQVARFWPLVVTAIPLTWSPQLEQFLREETQRP